MIRRHSGKKFRALILFLLFSAVITSAVLSQSGPVTTNPASEPSVTPVTDNVTDNAALNLHRWGAVTLFHGLPSDRVNAIAEDTSGALWFGTDNGLVRYDGRQTQLFTGEGANTLPSARIRALKLDAAGALWIGTDAGAARLFDGQLERIPAAEGQAVRAFAESPQREFTLVTERGEILRFVSTSAGTPEAAAIRRSTPYADPNFGNSVTQKLDPSTHWQLSSNEKGAEARPTVLTSLAFQEKTGEWWIGSHARGALVNKDGELREAALRPPRPYFVDAVFAAAGRVWLGAQTGRQGSGLWFVQAEELLPFPLGTGSVTAIHGDEEDLWIGTSEQGAYLIRNSQPLEHLTFENTAGGLRSNHINTIFRDHEGIIWFGTDRGVCRYDRDSFRAARVGHLPDANFIRTLLVTKQGETLAGTNRGLFTLARGAEPAAWAQVTQIEGRSVFTLTEDATGAIWAGTDDGIYVRRAGSTGFTPVGQDSSVLADLEPEQVATPDDADTVATGRRDKVRAVVSFRGQIYALVFGRGIERIEAGRRGAVLTSEPARRALCLAVEPGGNQQAEAALWIGTTAGRVWRFDGSSTTQIFPKPDQPQTRLPAVHAIAFASGHAWFGTERGLFEWNGESAAPVLPPQSDVHALFALREQHVPEVIPQAALGRFVPGRQAAESAESAHRDGFTESPEQLSQPREVLWVGTKNAGLYKLLARDKVAIRFDTEQGLISQQIFAVAADQDGGRVWIGTNRGVVLHQPSDVAPRIEATRLVADRVYPHEDLEAEVNFPHTQTNFLLEVTALGSRNFPGQFQYEFTLRDKLGQPVRTLLTSDSQFAVEKLPRGPYSVQVRAISRDLVYSQPLKVRFRIPNAPFPWTTVMLASLLTVALAAAGYAFIQNRRIARANRQLAETNEELHETRIRLANETEAERSRIARDLHDQTLADLRHLLVLTDQMEKSALPEEDATLEAEALRNHFSASRAAKSPTPAVLRREIESISSEIRHICEDLSPSALENLGFLPALEWALNDAVTHLPAGEKFAYEFNCESDLEDRLKLSEIERIQLYRIVQEVINNICRHAQARQVQVNVRSESVSSDEPLRSLVIAITDDGIGFDSNSPGRTGHGMLNIRSRANLINAQVTWQAGKDNQGCRFEVRKNACVT